MYATVNGFTEFMGAAAGEWFTTHLDADRLLSDCETRMAAYIVPNTPQRKDQIKAFETAVYAQLEHETSAANAQIADMPGGLSGFTVNGFSATFRENGNGTVFHCGISKRAKAELLRAGLLYRGVCIC